MVRRTILAAVAGVLLLTAPALGDDQPAVAEKSLRYWVLRLLDENPKVRRLAVDRIHNDFYVESRVFEQEICYGAAAFRTKHKSLAPLLLTIMKDTEDEEVFQTAALLAAALGPEAKSILPGLQQLAERKTVGDSSRIMALVAILFVTPEDQAVGPIIIQFLNALPKKTLKEYEEDDELSRAGIGLSIPWFAGLLAGSGHTKVEVPYLCKIATGDYPATVRAMAIGTLGALEFEATAAVPTLHRLLQDEDLFIRGWAADSLLGIKPDKTLIPEIVKALKLEGKERKEAEQSVLEFLKSKEEERKLLEGIDENDDTLLPMLVYKLKYGNGFYRRQAIRNLAIIGPEAKQALPLLKESLNDPDEETRQLAADAIMKIEAK